MKKIRRQIAAIACAALMSAQFMAVTVSADTNVYLYNGKYYEDIRDAYAASGGTYVKPVEKSTINLDSMSKKYIANGVEYDTRAEAEVAGKTSVHEVWIASTASVPSYTGTYYGYWYSTVTKQWYSSRSAALAASNNNANNIRSYYDYYGYYGYYGNYSEWTGYWQNSRTGTIYLNREDALKEAASADYIVPYYGNSYYPGNATPGSIYKYRYKGVDYPSIEAAMRAGGTALGVDIFYLPVGTDGSTSYYYYYNGTYYGSLTAAQNAGGKKLGEDITLVPYNYYGNAYNNYYGYYGNNYYYGMYADPYYTYQQIIKNNNTSSSSSSSKEAEDGEPYIYGNKKKAGWDTVVSYINSAKKGATINVDMNGAVVVSESVMKALKGKDVNVRFVLDNGVRWTVNGKNITNVRSVNIYTEYNINYIPASLVKKASENAITKAQIGFTTSFDDLGTKATVSVKFSKSRAGCTAVAYRYDPNTNSLKGVSKSTVQSDGRCSFNITEGGPYLVVLK